MLMLEWAIANREPINDMCNERKLLKYKIDDSDDWDALIDLVDVLKVSRCSFVVRYGCRRAQMRSHVRSAITRQDCATP